MSFLNFEVLIDYRQHMRGGALGNCEQEVGIISRSHKELANELNTLSSPSPTM